MAGLLRRIDPHVEVVMVTKDTLGDRRRDLSIAELGGKGVFSKEVQQMVLAGEADIAVHSAKDLQATTPDGLVIAALPERGDPRDALVGCHLADLPVEASVATGSNRRGALLLEQRPDIRLQPLRGNIETRLARLDDPDADVAAVVMAAVALERLHLRPDVVDRLDPQRFVPQVGQGALAVEARTGDHHIIELLTGIDHAPTSVAVRAERSFLAELGGDCDLPAGAHAIVTTDARIEVPRIEIRGVLADRVDGRVQHAIETGPPSADPGRVLARRLRKLVEAAAA